MSNLFELVSRVTSAMEAITEAPEGADVTAAEAELRSLIVQETDKVAAVALVLQRMESEAAGLYADAETLAAGAKRLERERERLRGYVLDVMRVNGVKSLKSPVATFSVLPGKSSVFIFDEPAVPDALRAEPKRPAPDKAAIRKALEAGEEVPGAQLVDGHPTLSVRMARSKATAIEE